MSRQIYLWLRILATILALYFMGMRLAHANTVEFDNAMANCTYAHRDWPNDICKDIGFKNCRNGEDPSSVAGICWISIPNQNYVQKFNYAATQCTPPLVLEGGQCVTPSNCAEMQTASNGPGNDAIQMRTGSFPTCVGGCSFGPQGPNTKVTHAGVITTQGDFGFSGLTCSATPDSPPPATNPPPPSPDPVCTPAGAGQTYCRKQDGKQCYTAGSTGKEICWDPTETGTKTEGPTAQIRATGSTVPPAPPSPPGDSYQQHGTPTTTTTSTTTTNGGTPTTTTHTVINYTNTGGTPAGTVDSGTPPSGTPTGTASGPSSATVGACGAAVACSGNAIDCAALVELNRIRCGQDSGGGVQGGKTCAVADEPRCVGAACDFTKYSGALQAWKTRCGIEALGTGAFGNVGTSVKDALGAAGPTVGHDDATGDSATGNGHGGVSEFGADGLDQSGRGLPRSCPSMPSWNLWGQSYTPDIQWLCRYGWLESSIILLAVGLFCLKYIVS